MKKESELRGKQQATKKREEMIKYVGKFNSSYCQFLYVKRRIKL